MRNSIVLFLFLLIIVACSKKSVSTASRQPVATTADSTASAPVIDMNVAENLFRQTCASCHALPSPAKHTAAEWPNTVNRMQHKSGFSNSQKEQIIAYLTANAKK